MATLEHLESLGLVVRHQPDLESWEMPNRMISLAPACVTWLDGLRAWQAKRGRNLTPFDQVEQIFYDFILGRPMAYSVNYRKLDPLANHVWELKTIDVRIFGWFARRAHFIAVCGDFKDNLPSAKFYKPRIESALAFRDSLDLDAPKQIEGVGRDAVL
jgi:hypothetical protein